MVTLLNLVTRVTKNGNPFNNFIKIITKNGNKIVKIAGLDKSIARDVCNCIADMTKNNSKD